MAEVEDASARRRLDLQPSKLSQLAEGPEGDSEAAAPASNTADNAAQAVPADAAADAAAAERQREAGKAGDEGDQLAGLVRAAVAHSDSPAVLALVPPEVRCASAAASLKHRQRFSTQSLEPGGGKGAQRVACKFGAQRVACSFGAQRVTRRAGAGAAGA